MVWWAYSSSKISLMAPRVEGSNPRRSSFSNYLNIQIFEFFYGLRLTPTKEPLEPLESIRLTLDVRVR